MESLNQNESDNLVDTVGQSSSSSSSIQAENGLHQLKNNDDEPDTKCCEDKLSPNDNQMNYNENDDYFTEDDDDGDNDVDDDDDEFFDATVPLVRNMLENVENLIANDINNNSESIVVDDDVMPSTSQGHASNISLEENLQTTNVLGKLFEKQKNEIALELRRLQAVSRSVTKTRLERFFTNNLNRSTQPRNPATFRSSEVVNEITQLSSQHRVSNLLGNVRENIERTLQNIMQSRSSTTRNNVDTSRNTPVAGPVSVQEQIVPNASTNTNPIDNLNSTRTTRVPTQPRREPIHRTLPGRVEPFLISNDQRNQIEQITREQIIGEISELVHRQLVSSTLQSEFRSTLERRVLDRLRRSGTDGERTRQVIRELAQNTNSVLPRNDFSDLGIMDGTMNQRNTNVNDDNLDSASSYNEPRTTHHRSNNSREIRELKSEITELKNMIKLSFELQLDMQRSLKQEIGALIAGTFQNSASASLVNSTRLSNDGKCVICTESQSDTVFYKCGHICACYACSMNLMQRGHNCPVCRAPIKDILRAYRTSLD